MSSLEQIFTQYEVQVIREIAAQRVHPNPVQRVLETVGRPVSRMIRIVRDSRNPALRAVSGRVQGWVEEGLIKTLHAANRMTGTRQVQRRYAARGIHVDNIESLRYLPISQIDAVADSFRFSSSVALLSEGALLGGATTLAEGIPGAQLVIPSLILADITSSMTLLSRHTCRIATTYGFSSKEHANLPHLIAAMAPQTDHSDEGYLAMKAAVVTSVRESTQFMARTAGVLMDRQILEREAPQMIRLIAYVGERLGVVVTEKQLGILVPVAGAILNAGLNLAFQQVGHRTAKNYFRRLLLEERYGEELVAFALANQTELLLAARNNHRTKSLPTADIRGPEEEPELQTEALSVETAPASSPHPSFHPDISQ